MVNTGFAQDRDGAQGAAHAKDNIIDLTGVPGFSRRGRDSGGEPAAEPILLDRDPVLEIAKLVHGELGAFLKELRENGSVQAGFETPIIKNIQVSALLRTLGDAALKLEFLFKENSYASRPMIEVANESRAIKGAMAELYTELEFLAPQGRLKNTASGRAFAGAVAVMGVLSDFITKVNQLKVQRFLSQFMAEDPSDQAS